MKTVYVKLNKKVLECEHVEGVKEEILGCQINSFEKVNEIPENFKPIPPESLLKDDTIFYIYDCEGVDIAYSSFKLDPKHYVNCDKIYFDENGSTSVEYREMTLDEYSKFCYLFKKNGKAFYLTY